MSFRKPSPRTLLVIDLASRKVIATRDENMNGGSSCAKITKPIYDAVKGGKAIMYYAHRPDDIRIPVEINGRFYAKPSKWVPKAPKVVAKTPPKLRKFFNTTGFRDCTHHVEMEPDGKFYAVGTTGYRQPCLWSLTDVEKWIKNGSIREEVTP